MKHGGLASLPEEVQWQIRLLLPRGVEPGAYPPPRDAEAAAQAELSLQAPANSQDATEQAQHTSEQTGIVGYKHLTCR